MKFHIVSEGREKADPTGPLVADYVSRVAKHFPISDTVCRRGAKNGLIEKATQLHSTGLLTIALDERGKEYTSEAFARQLEEWFNRSPSGLLFIIGGAEGLPQEIRSIADHTIALSRMTLPHRFARLILAEQIYRGLCIQKNTPYHK